MKLVGSSFLLGKIRNMPWKCKNRSNYGSDKNMEKREYVKKGILVVSFGTSHEDTRIKTIDAIEEEIAKAFPQYKLYSAYTSKMIIKKLKQSGTHILNVTEALEQMYKDGITELYVQPTHLINGTENDLMLKDIQEKEHLFEKVKVGAPLLNETEDYKFLVEAVMEQEDVAPDSMIAFMGHGSSHHSNSAYPALAYVFKELGYKNVTLGTVEGYPAFKEMKKELDDSGKKKVTLIPLMIVAGDHAKNDMAGDDEDSWKTKLERDGYEVYCKLQGLGELPKIHELLIKHIEAVM